MSRCWWIRAIFGRETSFARYLRSWVRTNVDEGTHNLDTVTRGGGGDVDLGTGGRDAERGDRRGGHQQPSHSIHKVSLPSKSAIKVTKRNTPRSGKAVLQGNKIMRTPGLGQRFSGS